MTLTVETGSASSASEAYISVADADTYFSNRGLTNWATMSTPEKEQAIRRAADYMGQTYRTRWAGYRVNTTQALDWPRYTVPRRDGLFTGYYPSDAVPREVVAANAELAFRGAAGELLADIDAPVTLEKVGPIEVTYAVGATKIKRYPAIDRLLAPLLAYDGMRVVRA